MTIDYSIPMSAGPAGAARIDASIPRDVDSQTPMSVKPFAPIDVVADTGKAYKLADDIGQFQENQSQRLEEQRVREEKQRDKMILEQYQQAGGDLYSTNGLELASKELKGKISLDSFDGLTKKIDTKKLFETKFKEASAKLSDAEFDLISKQHEGSTRMLSRALTVYDETLDQTKDPQKAGQAYESAKKALVESVKTQRTPSGDLLYQPEELMQFEKMPPEQLRGVVAETKWRGQLVKDEAVNRMHNAQADAAISLSDKRDEETKSVSKKLDQAQQRIDASLEKSKNTGKFDPADADAAAQLISEYKLAPLSGFAMRTPYGQKVMALAKEKNEDYDAKEYYTRSKSEKDFATGKQGNTVRSFNVAINHLDTLSELGDALKNGNVKRVNQLGNIIQTEFGLDAAPNNFEAAKKIVGDEIVKAIIGTGGGVTDREEASAKISAANSPEVLSGVINTYKSLMKGQLDGLKTQYKAATGKDDFDKRYLTAKAQKVAGGNLTVSKEEQTDRDKSAKEIKQDELKSEKEKLIKATTPEDKHRVQMNIESLERELGIKPAGKPLPPKNIKGWKLMQDAKGNKAYVGPGGEIEEVK